jgi:hypothetical protein
MRLVEDLGDEAPALVAIELHDHVDHDAQQPLDLVHAQAAAGAGLADHQRHLLEGQGAAARMDAGDAARVAGGSETHEVEALVAAYLGQEDAVGLHPQAGFEQRLRRHARRALGNRRLRRPARHLAGEGPQQVGLRPPGAPRRVGVMFTSLAVPVLQAHRTDEPSVSRHHAMEALVWKQRLLRTCDLAVRNAPEAAMPLLASLVVDRCAAITWCSLDSNHRFGR